MMGNKTQREAGLSERTVKIGPASQAASILQLTSSMLLGHLAIENPVFGAAFYLFMAIWVLYIRLNFHSIGLKRPVRLIVTGLFVLGISMGCILIFIYPVVMRSLKSLLVISVILLVFARDVVLSFISGKRVARKREKVLLVVMIHLVFTAVCIYLCGSSIPVFFAVLIPILYFAGGLLNMAGQNEVYHPSKSYPAYAKLKKDVASYAVYTNMALYSYIALYLGIMMYICYMCFLPGQINLSIYGIIVAWVMLLYGAVFLFYRLLKDKKSGLRLGVFITGAVAFIVSLVMLFRTESLLLTVLWSLLWAFGLSAMYTVMARLNEDFKLVARLMEEELEDRKLRENTAVLRTTAFFVSGIIMLCILGIWSFWIPSYAGSQIPKLFRSLMTALPMLFMLISIGFALRQPLDEKNHQRLEVYGQRKQVDGQEVNRLKTLVIKKYSVRFGVKILMGLIRPFFRHQVIGRENIDTDSFPSIFVCNHGEVYGPIAAVMYLPVYFRPWIDDRMLDKELIEKHMVGGSLGRLPVGAKWQKRIAHFISAPVRWALSSFEPIPVKRSDLSQIMQTMNQTVNAMLEGDNVLLFPEDPKATEEGKYETSSVGEFFTGFAHMGKLYYRKTGKSVKFYPVYASKKNRTFEIGRPICYDPSGNQTQEKKRIARELHHRMLDLTKRGNEGNG